MIDIRRRSFLFGAVAIVAAPKRTFYIPAPINEWDAYIKFMAEFNAHINDMLSVSINELYPITASPVHLEKWCNSRMLEVLHDRHS